jgi:spermidine synthase
MPIELRAGRFSYAALFLVALSTLMYEVLLTRIFSVTMYYHFAFVAVSVALFGMTLGAVLVYLMPGLFAPERARRAMAVSSLLFGITTVLTFIVHLKQEYTSLSQPATANPISFAGTYALISIPFIFSGIAVCLALTRFPGQVSRLYAADLAGAALGCILFILALRLTDGPTAVLIVAALAILAAVCSALDEGNRALVVLTSLVFLGAAGLAGLNGWRGHQVAEKRLENLPHTAALALRGRWIAPPPPVRIEHAKGGTEWPALFEEWNSFSRIRVRKEVPWLAETEPSGWGMSPAYQNDPTVPKTAREMVINIDAGAGTYMTHFDNSQALHLLDLAEDHESQRLYYVDQAYNAKNSGKTEEERDNLLLADEEKQTIAYLRQSAVDKAIEAAKQQAGFLKYDVTNFAHFLRPNSDVLVIGSGGGRDLLSALVFEQKHATGVEINDAIIKAMKGVFGDFTGHLDRLPNVEIVHDEARSYITRMDRRVDIIQISLIDTWAATAAGAFVLSENSLYTTEAWHAFLTHLTDRGVVTVSRWYHPRTPGETLRMVSLANQALRDIGVKEPRRHLLVVKRYQAQQSNDIPSVVATVIASRAPLTDEDLAIAQRQAKQMEFDLILTPRFAADQQLAAVADSSDPHVTAATFPINVAPPTDDKPFFFNMTRMRDAFNPAKWQGQGHDVNLKAVQVVAGLLVFVIVLTVLCVIVPVLIKADKAALRGSLPLTAFFVFIGLAFILVEISQMQRLIILLGHPTYSLSVVLFALLVSSGIGSYLTKNVEVETLRGSILWRMMVLLALLVAIGLITPAMIRTFVSSATVVRVGVALVLLMPAGLFMGMCFPLGMKAAAARSGDITAWLWGINGAMSVVASVLAVVIAMSFGISASWWTGVGCYGLGLLAIGWGMSDVKRQMSNVKSGKATSEEALFAEPIDESR